jgi:hypothetical protein
MGSTTMAEATAFRSANVETYIGWRYDAFCVTRKP